MVLGAFSERCFFTLAYFGCSARRSIFGVIATGVLSWHPIQSFMSSTAMNYTLDCLAKLSDPSSSVKSASMVFW